ncbi:unnamed protein product, partial [Aphanomyces euteiches]
MHSLQQIYEEGNRIALVSATALEDETVDRQPTDAIDDMNTWWQFAPHADDPSSSTMTVLGQSNISRLVHYKDLDAEPDEVVLVLKRILTSLDRPAEAP